MESTVFLPNTDHRHTIANAAYEVITCCSLL